MDKNLTIQSLLLKWFRHHGSRSIPQIKIACENLNTSFSTGIKYPLFLFFMPLVRKGYVEFIGHGKYQPGPPAIIYNKKDEVSTAMNLSDSQVEYIQKNVPEVKKLNLFRTIRFKSRFRDLKRICKNLNIDYTDNNIIRFLSEFPKLTDVISQYKKAPFSHYEYHFDVFQHSWINNKKQFRLGIHKAAKDAQQYFFRMNKDVWLKIPRYEVNPDSRYICETYQALLENRPFIYYDEIEEFLKIQTISIPILIERVLRIPSLHMEQQFFRNHKEQVYQNISMSAFRQLNRIFSNGIKIL